MMHYCYSMQADLYQRMEHMRRAEMERDADKWYLFHEARRGRPWFVRGSRRLLCQLGRWLIAVGRALQRFEGHGGDAMQAQPWRAAGGEQRAR